MSKWEEKKPQAFLLKGKNGQPGDLASNKVRLNHVFSSLSLLNFKNYRHIINLLLRFTL